MLGPRIHRTIFLFGILSLGFGMMIGTVPTSIPLIILLGNWLLEMDFPRKWSQLRTNKVFWILASVFIIHAAGLIYTGDMRAGMDDVRTKSPLFFLPMILFTSAPLSKKEFLALLYCFVLGCVVNTAWCYIYTFILHRNETVRSASRFMSHIRLSLYLNMAICSCVYLAFRVKNLLNTLLQITLIIYFLFIMYALGLASGFANFCIVIVLMACYFAFRKGIVLKVTVVVLLTGTYFGISSYIKKVYNEQFTIRISPVNHKLLLDGHNHVYYHYPGQSQVENGYYVHYNIHLALLRQAWNRKFPDDTFDTRRLDTQAERFNVLLRYMTSKGYTKDSAHFAMLSDEDLENIKNGITNYQVPEWSYLHKRTYELVNEIDEFRKNQEVSGHSVKMRLYFWKNAFAVIGKHLWTGVGTGDVQEELNRSYVKEKIPLTPEWYKRPHNQFLTVLVALGLLGGLIFALAIFAPVLMLGKHLHILYWPFFTMALVSFLMEDTLESQAGLTFYAFFNSVLMAKAWHEKTAL